MNLWAWHFNKAQTIGIGRRVADIEAGMDGDVAKEQGETEHVSFLRLERLHIR
jgi:hypothetical protein